MKLGETAIANIKLDPKSRDDIPQILRGLQHIFITPELREAVFAILAEVFPKRHIEGKAVKADPNTIHPGTVECISQRNKGKEFYVNHCFNDEAALRQHCRDKQSGKGQK
jgi:hypothetical protein